ncbi:DUF397 domain-containing protein [Thermomonospora cellulosilytica]|uniref:DUF397 domain-containing protein n=1 Tax=Thermomonospora cellulosilytica TaxID=1411118 RepID=A0A7W3R7U3_9ACTN|nr:DUF397 domain-containing protein [Thermomonospora cellulosilytica]MBA9002986.1 hypothetical protein [Thermomonospora cellulosilytica]
MNNDGTTQPVFRKSSWSGAANNNCVEVAATPGDILIRDSKHPDGGVLRLSRSAARALLEELRTG